MNQLRFLSREKLVEYLDEELRLFLNNNGIYEINQYGWLADNHPDPEYIGIAMWQTNPPREYHAPSPLKGMPEIAPISQADLEEIAKTGLEFEGLMQTARHSIGFSCLYYRPTDPLDLEMNLCFQHHYADAVMKLNMATDRLRDLFISSFSAISDLNLQNNAPAVTSTYFSKDAHHLFCLPFYMTREKLADSPYYYEELLACFEVLVPLIEQASFYRLKELNQSNCIANAENNLQFAEPGSPAAERGNISASPSNSLGENATQYLADWYKVLVKTGSQIFLAEYLLRNFDKKSPNC